MRGSLARASCRSCGSKEGHWSLGSDWQQSPDDSKLRHWMASKLRGAVKKGCRAGGQGGQALWPVSCSRWPSLPWPLPGGWKQAVSQFCANISQGASAQGSFRNHSLVGRTVLECLPLLCLPLAASLPPSLLSPPCLFPPSQVTRPLAFFLGGCCRWSRVE